MNLIKKLIPRDERSLKQHKTIIFSFLFKGSSIACTLLIVPASLKYLGNTSEYGLWLTISSIVSWISFLDGGLGNGLKNKLSECFANKNLDKAKTLVSTAYVGITVIAALSCIIFILLNNFLDWSSILKAPVSLKHHLQSVTLIIFTSFFLRLILDLVNSILTASQKLELVSFVNLIINLFQVVGIVLLNYYSSVDSNRFILMAVLYSTIPLVVLLALNLILFKEKFAHIKPAIKDYDKNEFKQLFTLGSKFFIIQIAVIIVFATDNIIITRLFTPADVTIYNICYKYFGILTFGWNILIAPYWVAFNDAFVKEDLDWIRTNIRYLERLVIGLFILIILFILLSPYVVRIWIGDSVQIPTVLSIYMGAFILVSCFTNIYVYLLNGLGKVNVQLYICIFASIINIPLCIIFRRYFNWGLEGIIFSSILTILPSLILGKVQYNKIINGFHSKKIRTSIWYK